MKLLNNNYFPRLYADFETEKGEKCLVQEFVSGQSLYQVIKQKGVKKGLAEDTAKYYFKQLVDAVTIMHSHSICHRDIKLENILITDRGRVKIIDFGFGIQVQDNQKLKVFCGTASYMAPEIIRKQEYSGFATDIWALGIVLYVMLTGRFPFKAKTEKELFSRIIVGNYLPPACMGFETKHLVAKMLSVDSHKRPSATDLQREQWFGGHSVSARPPNIISY